MENKFKIANPYQPIFKNYALTELVVLKENGRNKQVGNNMSVHLITENFLTEYGVHLWGQTSMGSVNVRYSTISKDIPLENELILQQLYGYKNETVDIGLPSGDEDCAYSFGYHTTNYDCVLKKHYHGEVVKRKAYPNFPAMMLDVKRVSSICELF